MQDPVTSDPRKQQAERFRQIAHGMEPSLARSGLLIAARHLDQMVQEFPNSPLRAETHAG